MSPNGQHAAVWTWSMRSPLVEGLSNNIVIALTQKTLGKQKKNNQCLKHWWHRSLVKSLKHEMFRFCFGLSAILFRKQYRRNFFLFFFAAIVSNVVSIKLSLVLTLEEREIFGNNEKFYWFTLIDRIIFDWKIY